MGTYNRRRFRQIMIDAELYRRLKRMRRRDESLGDVIRRLLRTPGRPTTKKGRPVEELLALGAIAERGWQRKLATGEVRVLGRPR